MARRKEVSLDEYRAAYKALKKEEAQRGFWIHFVVYFLVNSMLILVNVIYSSGVWWFFYPLIGWGIGLTLHYLTSHKWVNKELDIIDARVMLKAKEKRKK